MTSNRRILSSSTLAGNAVVNHAGENLGNIKDFMVDTSGGQIAYAVLTFGGFLGMGDKLFAVPMSALSLHPTEKSFILDTSKEHLKTAPGFDKDKWPDFASPEFETRHSSFWASATSAHAANR
jgi:sporulation protein YlmC with PRC-barrel domain